MSNRVYNTAYTGERSSRVAFPLGGIGAGMLCLEGAGALSQFSLRHAPDTGNEPTVFSAVCIKGKDGNIARVLEGPVPSWKVMGIRTTSTPGSGVGLMGKTYGLPRFANSSFQSRFPFGTVELTDPRLPISVAITGWSPFIPLNADDSSLPVAGLEFAFTNASDEPLEIVYSFHAVHFMEAEGQGDHCVRRTDNGFELYQPPAEGKPWVEGSFSAATDQAETKVDCAWFRGSWFDPVTMAWRSVEEGAAVEKPAIGEGRASPGGSLYVPLELQPGERRTVKLMLSWYVPESNLSQGDVDDPLATGDAHRHELRNFHKPWYAGRFGSMNSVAEYWTSQYERLRAESEAFFRAFNDTTLPAEMKEAATANLSILKSPTVLRQADGRLWAFEGCDDTWGSCHGTCTHVWNYAQAIPHLFPDLERGLRMTEFIEGQNDEGHQNFRIPLPIQPATHLFHAASDGQLGGIMKVYREWRVGGNTQWLAALWPRVQASLNYCIQTWDPEEAGVLTEPHHNTYDIEFWGPDGMCSSIYLGALKAAFLMARALGDDPERYEEIYRKGRSYVETELFNGEYFEQKVVWEGLRASAPVHADSDIDRNLDYSPEAIELMRKEGPKYQYGKGCLSDGIIGAWLAEMCGLGDILDREKVKSHLLSVYTYNLKRDLSEHANPQRPGYALGREGGLLLCTWPRGGKLSLPFVYSNEVWTGIEYQVASHLIAIGCVEEGLEIVRICRDRYDGVVRNPYNEYECGHWYARALASYGLIQAWSGIRYDAVEQTLYVSPRVTGDYLSFLCTNEGYGIAGIKDGRPYLEVRSGRIPVNQIKLSA